jgi:hypothetical protein
MTLKKFFCQNCGAENDANVTSADLADSGGDWLDCLPPHGFEWVLPAGVITPAYGAPIYISANGEQLSRQAYQDEYHIDPKIALQFMRGKLTKTSIFKKLNLLDKDQGKASQTLKLNTTDDDDWTA